MAARSSENFFKKTDKTMKDVPITINERKDAFFSLKMNEKTEYDKIIFNFMKNCFVELCNPLKYTFHLSFEKGILRLYDDCNGNTSI